LHLWFSGYVLDANTLNILDICTTSKSGQDKNNCCSASIHLDTTRQGVNGGSGNGGAAGNSICGPDGCGTGGNGGQGASDSNRFFLAKALAGEMAEPALMVE
jgi:hypothetical protein